MGGKLTQVNGQRMAGGKPIPDSSFALPGQRYPVDTIGRARNALSRVAQNGTPEEQAKVKAAVRRKYKSVQVGGGTQDHASSQGDVMALHFADDGSMRQCPNCGYRADDANFQVDGGASGTSSPNQPEQLRTPQGAPNGGGMPLTVRGASSGNLGLANRGGRVIGLARRMPVRQSVDLMVSRADDGTSVIRHRQGGNEVARMQRTANGWQPVVDGRALGEHRHQRAALLEAVGVYNQGSQGQPLQPPPQQTPLMQQFGVPAIRLASDDMDTDDDNTSDSGLTPKGQTIYKKLCAKGISPKVALAMAKRSQNTKPGSFSTSTSKAS